MTRWFLTVANYELGELYYRITGDNSDLNKALTQTDKQVTKTGKGFSKLGKLITGALSVEVLRRFGKASISAASNSLETQNKFKEVYSSIRDEANKTALELQSSYKLAQQESQDLLSQSGLLLQGLNLEEKQALDLSKVIVGVSSDIASFRNISEGAERVQRAITSALLGEREALKSLGIKVSENDIKLLAEDQGVVGELTAQQKALFGLQAILQSTEKDYGDFGRTSDSFANQTRQLKSAFLESATLIGNDLLPSATALVTQINELVRGFNDLDPGLRKIIIGGLVLGGTGGVLYKLTDGFSTLSSVMKIIPRRFLGVGLVVTGVAASFATLVSGIIKTDKETKKLAVDFGITTTELASINQEIVQFSLSQDQLKADQIKELANAYGITGKQVAILADLSGLVAEGYENISNKQSDATEAAKGLGKAEDELAAVFARLTEYQKQASESAPLETTQEATDLVSEYAIKLRQLGATDQELIALSKELALADKETWGGTPEQIAQAEASIDAYYKKLSETTAWEALKENSLNSFNTILSASSNLFSALASLSTATTNKRLNDIDRELQAALESAGLQEETKTEQLQSELDEAIATGDAALIKEAQDNLEREQIEAEYEKKKREVQYKAAIEQWKLQKALAGVNAAQALIMTATATPFPWNIPLTAAQGIINGINIAAINASKPEKPTFERGGVVQRPANTPLTGDNVTAGLNPFELVSNQEQQANLLYAISNGSGLGGGGNNITINIMTKDKKTIARETVELVNNAVYTIDPNRGLR